MVFLIVFYPTFYVMAGLAFVNMGTLTQPTEIMGTVIIGVVL